MVAASGRMLLSHNFNLPEGTLPALSRAEFAQTFQSGLAAHSDLQCQPIENPHWIVEVRFDPSQRLPLAVGQVCLQALAAARRPQLLSGDLPHWLALGGVKSTPASGSSPTSLQQGEWGVDVVETASADAFLKEMGWEQAIAGRDAGTVFKVEIRSDSP